MLGGNVATHFALLSTLKTRDRLLKGETKKLGTKQLDYELLVVDITDRKELNKIGEKTKLNLFGADQREVKWYGQIYDEFSIIKLPLTAQYLREGEDAPWGDKIYSSRLDQVAFAVYFIAEIRDHVRDITDYVNLDIEEAV